MPTTVIIHGSGGMCLVPFGCWGVFVQGRRRTIRVTSASKDASTPEAVRDAFVGMEVPVVLSGAEANKHFRDDAQIDPRAMLAYASEAADALRRVGRHDAAEELKRLVPDDLDMWVFEPEVFEVVPSC